MILNYLVYYGKFLSILAAIILGQFVKFELFALEILFIIMNDEENPIRNLSRQSRTRRNSGSILHIEENRQNSADCLRSCWKIINRKIQVVGRYFQAEPTADNNENDSFMKKFGFSQANQEFFDFEKTPETRNRNFKEFIVTFFVDSSSNSYYWWLGVISVISIYNILLLPTRAVFIEVQNSHIILWLIVDYSIDIINAFDMFVGFRTGYLEQGLIVTDVTKLKKNYMLKWEFKLDLLSLVPFEIFSAIPQIGIRQFPFLRFNRLIKCYKLFTFADRTETRINFPNMFRILMLIFYILILIHLNACIYFFISTVVGLGADSWVYPPRGPDSKGPTAQISVQDSWNSFLVKYIYSFYWSTLILTTIAETPPPVKNYQFIFITIDLLAGVLIFATIVGNVGSMITNMNAARSEFQMKMDGVKRYMEFRKVNKELEERVIKWFDYIWSNKQSLDEKTILATLPDKLKAEIAIHVHFDTLKRVNIFQDCEPGLLVELVLKLHLQVFSPGDYICRKGDIGKEMYIVKQGKLGVVSDDGNTVFVTLNAGSVFGEISILNIAGSKTGNRRTANVKSIGYSDLFCLNKNDLWDVLDEYPEARNKLIERGKEMLQKDNLLDLDALAEAEKSQQTMEMKLKKLDATLEILLARLSRLQTEYVTNSQKFKQRINKWEMRIQFSIDEQNKLAEINS